MQITTPPSQPDQVDNNNDMGPTSSSQPQTPSSSALSAAMATSDRFDFEAEYENLKHNLKFFDEAIPKKKDLERAVEALESAKSEKSMLQEHKRQAEAVLGEKRQNWRELRATHDKNQQEWQRRAIKADDVLFKADHHLDWSSRSYTGLEKIEVAKENLRLLEERRQADQAHAAMIEVRQGPKTWQARIDHQDQKIKKCEEEVLKIKKALDDAVEQWTTKNRIWNPADDSDLLLLKSTLKEQGDEIASLRKHICSLEETCKSDRKTIKSLETRIEQDEPLLKVGIDILRRKQEMEKPKAERDMAAIERGNKAAHYGTALADARRVVSGSAEERTWYSEFYGPFTADFVSQFGPSAPTFVEVVDWHAAVKNFQKNVTCDYSNKFITQFKIFVCELWVKHMVLLAAGGYETYLKDDQQGKNHYKILKFWYEAAYTMHKKRRVNS